MQTDHCYQKNKLSDDNEFRCWWMARRLYDFIWVVRPLWNGGVWAETWKMKRKHTAKILEKNILGRGTASTGQQSAWGILEPSGWQCAWVLRQKGKVGAAGRSLIHSEEGHYLRWLRLFPKTTCQYILLNLPTFYQNGKKMWHSVMHILIMVMDTLEQLRFSILDFINSNFKLVHEEAGLRWWVFCTCNQRNQSLSVWKNRFSSKVEINYGCADHRADLMALC